MSPVLSLDVFHIVLNANLKELAWTGDHVTQQMDDRHYGYALTREEVVT